MASRASASHRRSSRLRLSSARCARRRGASFGACRFDRMTSSASDVIDVAPGLWIWRVDYPDWRPEVGWPRAVSSTCVESGGEVAVLDALAPTEGSAAWER